MIGGFVFFPKQSTRLLVQLKQLHEMSPPEPQSSICAQLLFCLQPAKGHIMMIITVQNSSLGAITCGWLSSSGVLASTLGKSVTTEKGRSGVSSFSLTSSHIGH